MSHGLAREDASSQGTNMQRRGLGSPFEHLRMSGVGPGARDDGGILSWTISNSVAGTKQRAQEAYEPPAPFQ